MEEHSFTYTIPININDLSIDEIKNYLTSKDFKVIFINYESGIDSHLKIKFENKLNEEQELYLMTIISRLNHTS